MKKFLKVLEIVPSVLLLFMACITSLSALTRYLFNTPIPDEYEISRLLLSVVICWGMALAFQHNDHIQLDVFWGSLSLRAKRIMARLGAVICLGIVVTIAVAMGFKVSDGMRSGILTVDLSLPVWGFHLAAWLGVLASCVVLVRQVISPNVDEEHADA